MKLAKKLIFNKFRVKKLLAISNLCWLYEGFNEKNNEKVAMKFEKVKAKYNLLETEAYNLYNLKGFGIPKLISYGKSGLFNVLIEEFLGLSIGTIWNSKKNKDEFKLKNVCMLALQVLDRLEYIHSKNYIHRDIKPDNFVIGLKDPKYIYIIDFGFAHQYRSSRTGKHIKFTNIKKTIGSIRFLSVNGNRGYEQSRRDDLESFGYMAIFLATNYLPWMSTDSLKIINSIKYHAVFKLKYSATTEKLCKGLPEEFKTYINYCKKLEFEQKPNYDYLRGLFTNILAKNEQINDYNFFWIDNKKLNEKDEKSFDCVKYKRKGSYKKRLLDQIKRSLEKVKSQERPTFHNFLSLEHVNSLNINSNEKKVNRNNINEKILKNFLPKKNNINLKIIKNQNINESNDNDYDSNKILTYQNDAKIGYKLNKFIGLKKFRCKNSKVNKSGDYTDINYLESFDNKFNPLEPLTSIDFRDNYVSNDNLLLKYRINELNTPMNTYLLSLDNKVNFSNMNSINNNINYSNIKYSNKDYNNSKKNIKNLNFKNRIGKNIMVKRNTNYKTLYEREKEKGKINYINNNNNNINLNFENTNNFNKINKVDLSSIDSKKKRIIFNNKNLIYNNNKNNNYKEQNYGKIKTNQKFSEKNIFNNIVNNSVLIFNKNLKYSNSHNNLNTISQLIMNENNKKPRIKKIYFKRLGNSYQTNQNTRLSYNPNILDNSLPKNIKIKKKENIINPPNTLFNSLNIIKKIPEIKTNNNIYGCKFKLSLSSKNKSSLLSKNVSYNNFNSLNLNYSNNNNNNQKFKYKFGPNMKKNNLQNSMNNIKNVIKDYNSKKFEDNSDFKSQNNSYNFNLFEKEKLFNQYI